MAFVYLFGGRPNIERLKRLTMPAAVAELLPVVRRSELDTVTWWTLDANTLLASAFLEGRQEYDVRQLLKERDKVIPRPAYTHSTLAAITNLIPILDLNDPKMESQLHVIFYHFLKRFIRDDRNEKEPPQPAKPYAFFKSIF